MSKQVCPACGSNETRMTPEGWSCCNRWHYELSPPAPKGEDLDVGQEATMPWDMPTDDRNVYTLIASKPPEGRALLEGLFKKYADLLFVSIQTADTLRAEVANLSSRCESLQANYRLQGEMLARMEARCDGWIEKAETAEAALARERELHHGIRSKTLREAMKAVENERLSRHQDAFNPETSDDLSDGAIGYSNAIRDAELAIYALLEPQSAPKPADTPNDQLS